MEIISSPFSAFRRKQWEKLLHSRRLTPRLTPDFTLAAIEDDQIIATVSAWRQFLLYLCTEAHYEGQQLGSRMISELVSGTIHPCPLPLCVAADVARRSFFEAQGFFLIAQSERVALLCTDRDPFGSLRAMLPQDSSVLILCKHSDINPSFRFPSAWNRFILTEGQNDLSLWRGLRHDTGHCPLPLWPEAIPDYMILNAAEGERERCRLTAKLLHLLMQDLKLTALLIDGNLTLTPVYLEALKQEIPELQYLSDCGYQYEKPPW